MLSTATRLSLHSQDVCMTRGSFSSAPARYPSMAMVDDHDRVWPLRGGGGERRRLEAGVFAVERQPSGRSSVMRTLESHMAIVTNCLPLPMATRPHAARVETSLNYHKLAIKSIAETRCSDVFQCARCFLSPPRLTARRRGIYSDRASRPCRKWRKTPHEGAATAVAIVARLSNRRCSRFDDVCASRSMHPGAPDVVTLPVLVDDRIMRSDAVASGNCCSVHHHVYRWCC